jgi:hypothetical protein
MESVILALVFGIIAALVWLVRQHPKTLIPVCIVVFVVVA